MLNTSSRCRAPFIRMECKSQSATIGATMAWICRSGDARDTYAPSVRNFSTLLNAPDRIVDDHLRTAAIQLIFP